MSGKVQHEGHHPRLAGAGARTEIIRCMAGSTYGESMASTIAARWGRYLLAGALLLAVLVASGIAAQLFATSGTLHGSAIEDGDQALYAHGARLRPLVEEAGNAQTLNIYGPGGRIIGQAGRDGSGGQEARHLLADHLSSTQAVRDGGGNVVAQFEYGPYGKTRAAGMAATKVRYRYTGHPWDESQGLYQTPARGYDPTQGRFLSVDPQRQGASPYAYAGNNPVGFVDPTGGVKYPFYVYTGYETREMARQKRSFTVDALSLAFGRKSGGNQQSISAGMFNSIEDNQGVATSSLAENSPHNYTRRDYIDYRKMYLFIGDKGVDKMERLAEGLDVLEGRKKGFASEVTIINFSGNEGTGEGIRTLFQDAGRNPLLVHAGVEMGRSRGGVRKVTKFTSGSVEYGRSEFVKYVHGLEQAHRNPQLLTVPEVTTLGEPNDIPVHDIEMMDQGDIRGDLSQGFYNEGEFVQFPAVPAVQGDGVSGSLPLSPPTPRYDDIGSEGLRVSISRDHWFAHLQSEWTRAHPE